MPYEFPTLVIKDAIRQGIIVQGGMGAGVSLSPLAGEAARRGGIGLISAVGLDRIYPDLYGNYFEAAKIAAEEAIRISGGNGMVGANFMAMMHTYRASVAGAIAGGVKVVFVGAGIPTDLPLITAGAKDVALVPIVSSAGVLRVICRAWQRRYNRLPDAVVLEGPLAGGHLGYKAEDIENPEFSLENLFPQVLAVAQKFGNFPVIVAGGIWDRADICRWLEAGAAGVQMGTRFLATVESGASVTFKQAVVEVTCDDIMVASNPGCPESPSGMPFRIIRNSPGFQEALKRDRKPVCRFGYMLHNGVCRALDESGDAFCICDGLLGAIDQNPHSNELPLFTVGANAFRVKKILSVRKLICELTGHTL